MSCNDITFVLGGDNSIWYKYKENDRYTFDNWASLGGYVTSKPTSSYFKNNAYVFVRGGDNGLWYRTYNLSSKTPSPSWSSLGGGLLSPATITQTPNPSVLFAFVRGADYALYHKLTSDGSNWSTWVGLGGYLSSYPACVVYSNSNIQKDQLYAFCIGRDGACYYKFSNDIGSSWNPSLYGWNYLGYPTSVKTSIPFATDQPSVVSGSDGRLYVFCKGRDNSAYYKTFNGSNWDSTWTYLGGYLLSIPVAISMGDKIYLTCTGGDHAAYYKVYYNGSWHPSQSDWYSLGGYIQGDPDLASVCATVYMSVRGGDNALYYKTADTGNNWDTNWIGLYGYIISDPSMTTISQALPSQGPTYQLLHTSDINTYATACDQYACPNCCYNSCPSCCGQTSPQIDVNNNSILLPFSSPNNCCINNKECCSIVINGAATKTYYTNSGFKARVIFNFQKIPCSDPCWDPTIGCDVYHCGGANVALSEWIDPCWPKEYGFYAAMDGTVQAYVQGHSPGRWFTAAVANLDGIEHEYRAEVNPSNNHYIDFYIDGSYKLTGPKADPWNGVPWPDTYDNMNCRFIFSQARFDCSYPGTGWYLKVTNPYILTTGSATSLLNNYPCGNIYCTTNPSGAIVYLNGTRLTWGYGTPGSPNGTPFTICGVPTGWNTIKYTMQGYRDCSMSVYVNPRCTKNPNESWNCNSVNTCAAGDGDSAHCNMTILS